MLIQRTCMEIFRDKKPLLNKKNPRISCIKIKQNKKSVSIFVEMEPYIDQTFQLACRYNTPHRHKLLVILRACYAQKSMQNNEMFTRYLETKL